MKFSFQTAVLLVFEVDLEGEEEAEPRPMAEPIPGYPGQEIESVRALPLAETGAAEFVEKTQSTVAEVSPALEALAQSQA